MKIKILLPSLFLMLVCGCDTFVGPNLINSTNSDLRLKVECDGYDGEAGIWRLAPNQKTFLGGRPGQTNTYFHTATFYIYNAKQDDYVRLNLDEIEPRRGDYYISDEILEKLKISK